MAWALDQDGRSLEELAAAMKIDESTLAAWGDGSIVPTVGQVSKLGEVLQRPRVFFFLPAPPASAGLPSGFRHPPGSRRDVSQAVLLAARRSRRMQRALASSMPGGHEVAVPAAGLADPPAEAASKVRDWLQVPTSARWSEDRDAVIAWRTALDEAGVFVFMLQLGKDEVRGFASWDDRAPLIAVNTSSVAVPARLFTLGHELAHLVLRQATACEEPAGSRTVVDTTTERWCEAFAGALLMPADEVSTLMLERHTSRQQAGIDDVKALMRRFRISARAAAVRLDGLGWAQPSLYAQVLKVFQPKSRKDSKPGGGTPVHVLRVREYGEHAIETLMTSLPPRDAMAVLRVDVEGARKLAEVVPGAVAV